MPVPPKGSSRPQKKVSHQFTRCDGCTCSERLCAPLLHFSRSVLRHWFEQPHRMTQYDCPWTQKDRFTPIQLDAGWGTLLPFCASAESATSVYPMPLLTNVESRRFTQRLCTCSTWSNKVHAGTVRRTAGPPPQPLKQRDTDFQ